MEFFKLDRSLLRIFNPPRYLRLMLAIALIIPEVVIAGRYEQSEYADQIEMLLEIDYLAPPQQVADYLISNGMECFPKSNITIACDGPVYLELKLDGNGTKISSKTNDWIHEECRTLVAITECFAVVLGQRITKRDRLGVTLRILEVVDFKIILSKDVIVFSER